MSETISHEKPHITSEVLPPLKVQKVSAGDDPTLHPEDGLSINTKVIGESIEITEADDSDDNRENVIEIDEFEVEVISDSNSNGNISGNRNNKFEGDGGTSVDSPTAKGIRGDVEEIDPDTAYSDHSDDFDPDDSDDELKEFQFQDAGNPLIDNIDLKLYDGGEIPPLETIKITKNVCSQVRNFLKTEGHMKFLDIFIPSGPKADDIIILTKLLGYVPKDIERIRKYSTDETIFLHRSIVFLREAINRVLKSRTRIPGFNTIDQVCNALKNAKNILVLTGAGISTSLGIPDFRSSRGFYSKMKDLGLDDPQDVFSLQLFKESPEIFYSIAYMILPPEFSYTPLHAFIKLLQDRGKLLRNYTQNIDNLEANAGVLPEKLVQCHGSFATASCITCKYKVPGETLYPNLRAREIAYCPFCETERKVLLQKYEKMEDEGGYSRKFDYIKSFGAMKPDITFFGEELPEIYHSTIKQDVRKCDLLICIGTSLKVAPVSEIVNRVPNDIPQILINRDPIDHCEFDVELLGYCDQVITWLCGDKLNWRINHKDFDKILNSGLQLNVLDETFGTFSITDAEQRRKAQELREQREREEDGGSEQSDKEKKKEEQRSNLI